MCFCKRKLFVLALSSCTVSSSSRNEQRRGTSCGLVESEVIVWWFVVLKKCEVIDFVSKTGKSFFGFGPARNSLFFTWVQRTFQTKAQKSINCEPAVWCVTHDCRWYSGFRMTVSIRSTVVWSIFHNYWYGTSARTRNKQRWAMIKIAFHAGLYASWQETHGKKESVRSPSESFGFSRQLLGMISFAIE